MSNTRDRLSLAPQHLNYQTLTHGDSTRVLILFPATEWDAELEGDLVETRLSDELGVGEGYMALSYAWGTARGPHILSLSKDRIPIRENLNCALRDLRQRDRPCRIWVDAICINQEDLEERNHQVQQMKGIYFAARNTIIYLGAQKGIKAVSAWNFLERNSSWAVNENLEVDYMIPSTTEEKINDFQGELADVEIEVLTRPWFRRLWVFQEAVVSRSLSIQCGRRRISWDDFCRITLDSRRHHDRYGFSLINSTRYEAVRDIQLARCEYLEAHGPQTCLPTWRLPPVLGQGNWLEILNMLARGRRLEASDPKDKIYGLLGISSGIDTTPSGFKVNYKESWKNTYARFARYIIQTTGRCDILSYVPTAQSWFHSLNKNSGSLILPTWVPDWMREPEHGIAIRTILSTQPWDSPAISRTERVDNMEKPSWTKDGRVLVLRGRIIGRFQPFGAKIDLRRNDECEFQALRNGVAHERARRRAIMTRWDAWVRGRYYIPVDEITCHDLSIDPSSQDSSIDTSSQDPSIESPSQGSIITSRSLASSIDTIQEQIRRRDDMIERWKHWMDSHKMLFRCYQSPEIYFDEENIRMPTTVETHLYHRSKQTATWSNEENVANVPIVDQDSIVDGRRLGICVVPDTELGWPQGKREWCLAPGGANENDIVVRLSGCRVPFVVRVSKPLFDKQGTLASATKQPIDCGIVGECVLNGIEEHSRRCSEPAEYIFNIY